MKTLALWCSSILIIYGLCQGVTARKPNIIPAAGELLIQEGNELRIHCQGEGRLQFSTQKNIANIAQSAFNILKDESSNTYTFIRNRTRKEDTGWYACAEEGVDIRNDERIIDHRSQDVAWIYVYVNSSAPFAIGNTIDPITTLPWGKIVIPCRPTSPDLPVKLVPSQLTDKMGVPSNIVYDPKIGFIISEVGRKWNSRHFDCRLEKSEMTKMRDDWPSYYIEVIERLEKPRINRDSIRHVVSGKDLIIECHLTVPMRRTFAMSWKVPKSVPKERWSYTSNPILAAFTRHGQVTWKTVLTVRNVEKTDEGDYVCAADHSSDHVESWVVIRIWDTNERHINARVLGSDQITVHREDKEAQWKIEIDMYDKNVEWEWYRPDGHIIVINELDNNDKYSHSRDEIYHYFKISKLDVEDSGDYTIKLSAEDDEKIITLQLTVLAEPVVHIDKVLPFYSAGKSATFTCQMVGLPLPNVTWIVKEYPESTSKENPELKYPSNITNKLGEKGPYHLVSAMDAKINQTADVTCRSCNENNCVDSTERIFVSDVAGLFGIIDPGLVTEGDDINVTCGASVYNFTDTITWRPEDLKKQEFNTSRIRSNQRRSNFTLQSILEIRNVSRSDAGKYICEAVTKGGFTESKEYQLIVKAALAPRFKNNSMDNSEISIDLKNETERSMVKVCFAEGMPIPQVSWYKNDQLLVESNQYKFSEDNYTLEISYFLDGDSGRYVCKAANRIGTAERYMDIKVAAKSQSHTILIGSIFIFVLIIIIVMAFMKIRQQGDERLRKEAALVFFQKELVEYPNRELTVEEHADLLRNV